MVRRKGNGYDYEEEVKTIWRSLGEAWQRLSGGGAGGKFNSWLVIPLIVLGIWLATGIYTVDPGEVGVILRFGEDIGRAGPGLHYHLPYPIETVEIVNEAVIRRVEIGFRSEPTYRVVQEESLMLTGDENIVDARAIVQYKVKNPSHYLFEVKDSDETLQSSAEVSLRSVIGRTTIDQALTVGRVKIQQETMAFLQQLLDTYKAGLLVTDLKLQVVDPPAQVKDAFHEVVRAREDRERIINEAKGYYEDVIPKARGEAEKRIRNAEAYKERRTIRSKGDASRFLNVLKEYEKAKEVTAKRLYLETMEQILPKAEKIILDGDAKDSTLQFLPLREMRDRQGGNNVKDGNRRKGTDTERENVLSEGSE